MEDPSLEEWKLEEYSPSGESSKVSWILNKGLGLGKKIMITGIVISSAPLVLPPLVVFSAIGLAFSVPFGFFFASYACTDKLMSKLLTRPTSPPDLILEYGTDEEKTSGGYREEDVGFRGIDMEDEEEEQVEDMKEGIKIRIEMEEQEPGAKNVDEIVEEGYEEDDEEEKEQPLEEIDVTIEGMIKEENGKVIEEKAEMKESSGELPVKEMGGVVVEENKENGSNIGVEVLPKGIRDEKNVGNIVEVMKPLGDKSGMVQVVSIIGEQKPVVDKKAMLQGGRTEDNISREKKDGIRLNPDAREIADEGRFKTGKRYSYSVYKTPEGKVFKTEKKQSPRYIGEGRADFVERPVSAGVPESKRAGISSDKDIIMPSDKNVAGEVDYRGGLYLEKQEQLMKDTRDGAEIRIELVEKRNEELELGNPLLVVTAGQGRVNKDEQKATTYEKERGYEEDFGDNLLKEEQPPLIETDVIIEGMAEEENVISIEEEKEIVIEECRDKQHVEEGAGIVVVIGGHEKNASNIEEVEEPVGMITVVGEKRAGEERVTDIEEGKPLRETRGALEESGNEVSVDKIVEEDDEQCSKEMCGIAQKGCQKKLCNVEEMEKLSEYKFVNYNSELEKPVEEMNMAKKKSKGEIVPKEKEKMSESCYEDKVDTVSKEWKLVNDVGVIVEGNIDKTNDDNSLEVEKLMGNIKGMINVDIMLEGEQKPMVDRKDIVHEGIAENYSAHEYHQLDREKGNAIFSDADVREIADESGIDLFDGENASALLSEVHENPEGGVMKTEAIYCYPPVSDLLDHKVDIGLVHGSVQNEQSSDNIGDKSSDLVELPISTNQSKSKRSKFRSARIASKKDITIRSNKTLYSEEKIWEKIAALRTIVGYKATSHATCIEELKALYIFTGVEPPASFKEHSDLVEVNDKLQFLMSIVGVK